MNDNPAKTRRSFLKGTALAAGALTLPTWISLGQTKPGEDFPCRGEEKAQYLGFFDPADGPVPNPGMGVSGYVHSDHMYEGYPGDDLEQRRKSPHPEIDRATFDKFVALPYVDNLYLRYDWRDLQKENGKLSLPDAWKWTLDLAETKGKRWSFRIMNCRPGSPLDNVLPEFLQGRFKMIPYWNDESALNGPPKHFPDYNDEYLDSWGEFVALLGREFDQHPQLEYVDVSGYGFWGEMHHIARYAPDGPRHDYIPGSRERAEVIMDRIIRDHLRAFPKTPAVLNLHAADYRAGLRAFEEDQVWARRDSFRYNFSTTEVRLAQGLKPGNGMVWEIIRPGLYCPMDSEMPTEKLYPIPQRYFDIAANYVAMGFNAWDAIWAHEHCLKTYEFIEQNIGYRVRPSIVWRRRLRNREEIVLGLRNDGCVAPPGQLTLQARFPDGWETSTALPMGEPSPGAMKMYGLSLPADAAKYGPEAGVELSMKLQMKGKRIPAQWAVKKWQTADAFLLKVPLKPS